MAHKSQILTIGTGTKQNAGELMEILRPLTGSASENPVIYVNVESAPDGHRNKSFNWTEGFADALSASGLAPVSFGGILGGRVKDPAGEMSKKELSYAEAYSTPEARAALSELAEVVKTGAVGPMLRQQLESTAAGRGVLHAVSEGKPVSIILQCSEDNVIACHRLYLSEILSREMGVTPEHIVRLRGGSNPVDSLISHETAVSTALTQMKMVSDATVDSSLARPWADDARAWMLWEHATREGALPLGKRASATWFDRTLANHLLLHPGDHAQLLEALHQSIESGDVWFPGVLKDDDGEQLRADSMLIKGNFQKELLERGFSFKDHGTPRAHLADGPEVTVVGGGAYGTDRFGDAVAKTLGWGTLQFYNGNVPTPFGNIQMSVDEDYVQDARKALQAAVRELGRFQNIEGNIDSIPQYTYNLLIRDYAQVAESDTVYAVGHWQDQERGFVLGGTGYAVQMAKGVRDTFFYDMDSRSWFFRSRGGDGSWEPLESSPRLSARPAIIGTRELTPEAAGEFTNVVVKTISQGVRNCPSVDVLHALDEARKGAEAHAESAKKAAEEVKEAASRLSAVVTMRRATAPVTAGNLARVSASTLVLVSSFQEGLPEQDNVITLPLMKAPGQPWTDNDIESFREHMDFAVDAASEYISKNAGIMQHIILPVGGEHFEGGADISVARCPKIRAYLDAKMSLLRSRAAQALGEAGKELTIETSGTKKTKSVGVPDGSAPAHRRSRVQRKKPAALAVQSFSGDVVSPSDLLDANGLPRNVDTLLPKDNEALPEAFRSNADLSTLYVFGAPAVGGEEEARLGSVREPSVEDCTELLRDEEFERRRNLPEVVNLSDEIDRTLEEMDRLDNEFQEYRDLADTLDELYYEYEQATTVPAGLSFTEDQLAHAREKLIERYRQNADYARERNLNNPSVLTFPSVREYTPAAVSEEDAIRYLRNTHIDESLRELNADRQTTLAMYARLESEARARIEDAQVIPTNESEPSRFLTLAEIGEAQDAYRYAVLSDAADAEEKKEALLGLVSERLAAKRDAALAAFNETEQNIRESASKEFDTDILPGLSPEIISATRQQLRCESRSAGQWTDEHVEDFRHAAQEFFADLLRECEYTRAIVLDRNICCEGSFCGIDPKKAPLCAQAYMEELKAFAQSIRERGREVYDLRNAPLDMSAKERKARGIDNIYTRGEKTGQRLRRAPFNIYGGRGIENVTEYDEKDPNHRYLSALAPHSFVDLNGLRWHSAEQYFHAQKALFAGNAKAYEEIRQTNTGGAARRIGHSIPFTSSQSEAWNERRAKAMFEAQVLIAEQDPAYRAALLSIPDNATVSHFDPSGRADTGDWARLYPQTVLAAKRFIAEGKRLVSAELSASMSATTRNGADQGAVRDAFDIFRESYGGSVRSITPELSRELYVEAGIVRQLADTAVGLSKAERDTFKSDIPRFAAIVRSVMDSDCVYLMDTRKAGSEAYAFGGHEPDYVFAGLVAAYAGVPAFELNAAGEWLRTDVPQDEAVRVVNADSDAAFASSEAVALPPIDGNWYAATDSGRSTPEQDRELATLFSRSAKASKHTSLRVYNRSQNAFARSAEDDRTIRIVPVNRVPASAMAERLIAADRLHERQVAADSKMITPERLSTAAIGRDILFPMGSPSGKPWTDEMFVTDGPLDEEHRSELLRDARASVRALADAMRVMEDAGKDYLAANPRGGVFAFAPANPISLARDAFLRVNSESDGQDIYERFVQSAGAVLAAAGIQVKEDEAPQSILRQALEVLSRVDLVGASDLEINKDIYDRIIALDDAFAAGPVDETDANAEVFEMARTLSAHTDKLKLDRERTKGLKGSELVVRTARLAIEANREQHAGDIAVSGAAQQVRSLIPEDMYLSGLSYKDFYKCSKRLERQEGFVLPAVSGKKGAYEPDALSAAKVLSLGTAANRHLENPYCAVTLAMDQLSDLGLFSIWNTQKITGRDAATGVPVTYKEFGISRIVMKKDFEDALPPKVRALYNGLKESVLTGENSLLANANEEAHRMDGVAVSVRPSARKGAVRNENDPRTRTRTRSDETWDTLAFSKDISEEQATAPLTSLSLTQLRNLLSRVEMPGISGATSDEDYRKIAVNLGLDPDSYASRYAMSMDLAARIMDTDNARWAEGISAEAIVNVSRMLIRPDGAFSELGRGDFIVNNLPLMADYINANKSVPDILDMRPLFVPDGNLKDTPAEDATVENLERIRMEKPAGFADLCDAVRHSCLVDLIYKLPVEMRRYLSGMKDFVSLEETRSHPEYDLLITNSSSAVKAIGRTSVSMIADSRAGGGFKQHEINVALKAGVPYGVYQNLIRSGSLSGFRSRTAKSRTAEPLTTSELETSYRKEMEKNENMRRSKIRQDGTYGAHFGMGAILQQVEANRQTGDGKVVMAVTGAPTRMVYTSRSDSSERFSGALISAVALARTMGLRIGFVRGREAGEVISLREAIDEALGDKRVLSGDPLAIEFSEDGTYKIPPVLDAAGKPILNEHGEPIPSVILGPKEGQALREDAVELEGRWNYGQRYNVREGGASRERVFSDEIQNADVIVNIRCGGDDYSPFVHQVGVAQGKQVVDIVIPQTDEAATTVRSSEFAAIQAKAISEQIARARLALAEDGRPVRVLVTAATMTQLANRGRTDTVSSYSRNDLRTMRGESEDEHSFDLHPDMATGVTDGDLNILWRRTLEYISNGEEGISANALGQIDYTYVGDLSTVPLANAEAYELALAGNKDKAIDIVFPKGFKVSFDTGGTTAVSIASPRLALAPLAMGLSLKKEMVEHDNRHEGEHLPDVVLVTLAMAGLTGEEIMQVRDLAISRNIWVEAHPRIDSDGETRDSYAWSLASLLEECEFLQDGFSSTVDSGEFFAGLTSPDNLLRLEEEAQQKMNQWALSGEQLITANSEFYPKEFSTIKPVTTTEERTVLNVRRRRPRLIGGERSFQQGSVSAERDGEVERREVYRTRVVGRPAFFTAKGDLNALYMPKVAVFSPASPSGDDTTLVSEVSGFLRRNSLSPVVSVPKGEFIADRTGTADGTNYIFDQTAGVVREREHVAANTGTRTDLTQHPAASYRILVSANVDEETKEREYSDFNLLPRPIAITGARMDDPLESEWIDSLSESTGLVMSTSIGKRDALTDLQSDILAGALAGTAIQIGGVRHGRELVDADGEPGVCVGAAAAKDIHVIDDGTRFMAPSRRRDVKGQGVGRKENGVLRGVTASLEQSGIVETVNANTPVILEMQKEQNAKAAAALAQAAIERERLENLQQNPTTYTIKALRCGDRTLYEVPSRTLQSVRDALVRDMGVSPDDIVEPGQAARMMPRGILSVISETSGTMMQEPFSSQLRLLYRNGHVFTAETAPDGTPGLRSQSERHASAAAWTQFVAEMSRLQEKFQQDLNLPEDVPFKFDRAYHLWISPTEVNIVGEGAVRLRIALNERGEIVYDKGYGTTGDEFSKLDNKSYDVLPYLAGKEGAIFNLTELDAIKDQIQDRLYNMSEFRSLRDTFMGKDSSLGREDYREEDNLVENEFRVRETESNIEVAENDIDNNPSVLEEQTEITPAEVYLIASARAGVVRGRIDDLDAQIEDVDRKIAESRELMKFTPRPAASSSGDEPEESEDTSDALSEAEGSLASELSELYRKDAESLASELAEADREEARTKLSILQEQAGNLRLELSKAEKEHDELVRLLDTVALAGTNEAARSDMSVCIPSFSTSMGKVMVFGRECSGLIHTGGISEEELSEAQLKMKQHAAVLRKASTREQARQARYEHVPQQAAKVQNRCATKEEVKPGSAGEGLCIVSRYGCEAYAKEDTLDIISAFYQKLYRMTPTADGKGSGIALDGHGNVFILSARGRNQLKSNTGAVIDTGWGSMVESPEGLSEKAVTPEVSGARLVKITLPGGGRSAIISLNDTTNEGRLLPIDVEGKNSSWFDRIDPFIKGVDAKGNTTYECALVYKKGAGYNYINTEGKVLFPDKWFTAVGEMKKGTVEVALGKKKQILDVKAFFKKQGRSK